MSDTILGISGTNSMQSQKLLTELLNRIGFKANIEKINSLLIIRKDFR